MPNSETKDLLAAYRAAGWSVTMGGKHYKTRCPYGCCQTSISTSNTGGRGDRNGRAFLRRCPGAKQTGEVHSGH